MRTSLRLLTLLLLVPAASLAAQASTAPWTAWYGCWAPSPTSPSGPITCVVPGANAASVDLLTVVDRAVTQRTTVVADGTSRPLSVPDCTGWEAARFSLDGDRVYLSSEVTCSGVPTSTTSGIFSISRSGDFIDVHGVKVGDQRNLRVRRSNALDDLALMPDEVRTALAPVTRVAGTARIGAGVPLSFDRVLDVAEAVEERVAEAWLVESSADSDIRLQVTADGLERMEAEKVPTRIIDVVVALGYPQAFQVAMGPGGGVTEVSAAPAAQRPVGGGSAHRGFDSPFAYYGANSWYASCMSPYYGYWGFTAAYLYMSMDRRNGCSGFGGMYDNQWGWGWYGRPVVVIVRPQPPNNPGGTPEPRGRVVRGGGYTQQTGTTGPNPAHPRGADGSTFNPPSGSPSGSSTSSATAGSAKGDPSSGGSQRTAKPRDP